MVQEHVTECRRQLKELSYLSCFGILQDEKRWLQVGLDYCSHRQMLISSPRLTGAAVPAAAHLTESLPPALRCFCPELPLLPGFAVWVHSHAAESPTFAHPAARERCSSNQDDFCPNTARVLGGQEICKENVWLVMWSIEG